MRALDVTSGRVFVCTSTMSVPFFSMEVSVFNRKEAFLKNQHNSLWIPNHKDISLYVFGSCLCFFLAPDLFFLHLLRAWENCPRGRCCVWLCTVCLSVCRPMTLMCEFMYNESGYWWQEKPGCWDRIPSKSHKQNYLVSSLHIRMQHTCTFLHIHEFRHMV